MLNKKHRILVVDNVPAVADMLVTILRYGGYETATAYSGEDAVQVASSFRPDCIVSDDVMGKLLSII